MSAMVFFATALGRNARHQTIGSRSVVGFTNLPRALPLAETQARDDDGVINADRVWGIAALALGVMAQMEAIRGSP